MKQKLPRSLRSTHGEGKCVTIEDTGIRASRHIDRVTLDARRSHDDVTTAVRRAPEESRESWPTLAQDQVDGSPEPVL